MGFLTGGEWEKKKKHARSHVQILPSILEMRLSGQLELIANAGNMGPSAVVFLHRQRPATSVDARFELIPNG